MKIIKILLFVLMLMVGNNSILYAYLPETSTTEYLNKLSFLSSDGNDVTLDNGLNLLFTSPTPGFTINESVNDNYYVFGSSGSRFFSTLTTQGVSITFKNTTNHILIIKWSESAFGAGDNSSVPFISGVKYKDAGNPSALPDLILTPGQKISKDIYLSNVEYKYDNWDVVGIPIPKDGSVTFVLTLKILDNNGNANYFSVNSPSIGILNPPPTSSMNHPDYVSPQKSNSINKYEFKIDPNFSSKQ